MIGVCYARRITPVAGDAMEERPVEYFSYLLRMWRTGEHSAWRASLEDPRTGERMGFGSLEALLSYLVKISQTEIVESNIKKDSPC